jgi:hypothetical protein
MRFARLLIFGSPTDDLSSLGAMLTRNGGRVPIIVNQWDRLQSVSAPTQPALSLSTSSRSRGSGITSGRLGILLPYLPEPEISGLCLLLTLSLRIAEDCPVSAARTIRAKTNHTWHVRTELPLAHCACLKRRSLCRVANRTRVFTARARQRVPASRIVRRRPPARSRMQSRRCTVPIYIRLRNGHQHQHQSHCHNAQHLN